MSIEASKTAVRGRPPRVPGVRARKQLKVLMTPQEYEDLREAAALAGQTLADYVRITVGGAAADDLEFDRRQRERRRAQVDVGVDRRTGQDRRG